MNREMFYETVKDQILSFMPEEFQDHTARIDEVNKSGDVRLHGLALTKGNSGAAPILYLDQYYERYENGLSLDNLLQDIAENYVDIAKSVPSLGMPDISHESIKDDLRVRLVYNKTNVDYLKDHVHLDVGCGYSLVVYADLSEKLFNGAIINIKDDMLESIGTDKDTLINEALNESIEFTPARLTLLQDELLYALDDTVVENYLVSDKKPDLAFGMFTLTTKDRYMGASTLFYPEMTEKIASVLGGSYHILPSSVHEMLIRFDDGNMSAKELADTVKAVNDMEVSLSEQLGNRVLYYDAATRQLSVACDLDRELSKEKDIDMER